MSHTLAHNVGDSNLGKLFLVAERRANGVIDVETMRNSDLIVDCELHVLYRTLDFGNTLEIAKGPRWENTDPYAPLQPGEEIGGHLILLNFGLGGLNAETLKRAVVNYLRTEGYSLANEA